MVQHQIKCNLHTESNELVKFCIIFATFWQLFIWSVNQLKFKFKHIYKMNELNKETFNNIQHSMKWKCIYLFWAWVY